MRTRKCAVIVGGCLGLLLVGLLLMDWTLILLVAPLFLFLLLGVLFFHGSKISVVVDRKLTHTTVFENDTVDVTLRIRNTGAAIQVLELYDSLPDRVHIDKGSNYGLLQLKQDEEIVLNYTISCPLRGHFAIGPLHLRVRDYQDLFFTETVDDTVEELTVIPQMEPIGDIDVKGKTNPYPGMMQTRHAGIGTEFFGVRQYQSGDTFRRINWKSFARWNNLMVNEYELESTTDIVFIVDARIIQKLGTLKHNPLEYGIKAAVSLVSHFLKRRDRVGLIIYGKSDEHLRWLFPESGRKQLYKTIKELMEVQAEGTLAFNTVVDTTVAYMLPKKSLIFLISSLEDDQTIPEAIQRLIARGHHVIVLSPSPIAIGYSLQSADSSSKLAYKVLSLERNNVLHLIRNSGARIIDWNPTLPLALALMEVERSQIRR